MDPRTSCYLLCPPVSETHGEGSTDLKKGGQSKHPQERGGKEISKGDGKDQLHLSGVVEKQDAVCMILSHVYKMEKKI